MTLLTVLESGLHHRNGFVRKGSALALRAPRWLARMQAQPSDYAATPPVLANSIPKSGTHLLDQIVGALPGRRNFGEFIATMTSSFQFKRQPVSTICARLEKCVPGELVRAHLDFHCQSADQLMASRIVHYFIYRDPRDVVVSEAHYLRSLNRWHRLHPFFRDAASVEDAISLSICGMPERAGDFEYPPIGQRFAESAGWIGRDDTCAVKFEDLISERSFETIQQMARFYLDRAHGDVSATELAVAMQGSIDPGKSHTYRKGSSGGWRASFTEKHREQFKQHAGEVLVQFGFETDLDW